MTDQNNAAPAATTNPLSDEYVNAVIKQHGYQSLEAVTARLHQWIGLHGGENGVTLLIYEAHKVLSKLRAPVADERAALSNEQIDRIAAPWLEPDGQANTTDVRAIVRAALASAPVAGEAQAEQFIQAAIDQAPEPLRRLGEYLSRVLDEDQWATAERMLLGACNAAPQASEADGQWRDLALKFDAQRMVFRDLLKVVAGKLAAVSGAKDDEANKMLDMARGALASSPGECLKAQASEAVRGGKWPMLSELHLHALMLAYNEGYSKACDGRVFPNPFSENGSQAAAWQLGTDDGTEARAALSAQPGAQKHDDGGTAHG